MRLLNKNRLKTGAFALLIAAGVICLLDRIFPPDLTKFRETSTVVLSKDDRPLHVFETSDGHWRLPVALQDVDPTYLAMLCAYEDKRFYHHPGVDPLAMARAIGQYITHGHVVSGGSTLTMQVARLLEPHKRSVGGKLFEILRALQLEERLSKSEILDMYLTLAPFGGNLDGVRSASLAYFGKEPKHLTLSEAGMLVALPQSPTKRRPDRHPTQIATARNQVLTLVGNHQPKLASDPADRSEAVPMQRYAFPSLAVHFSLGLAKVAPGQTIPSTIDAKLQAHLETLLASELAGMDNHVNAAMMVVDNRTGNVLASIGGRDLQGPGGYVDMTRAVRSPGSTLKPFIYGMAFDDLIVHPDTLIDDTAMEFDGYAPRNFDRQYHGLVTVREALQQSLNIPAIEIMQRVGPGRFTASLSDAGAALQFPNGEDANPGLAIALGGVGISLRDLVMLHAGLGAGGQAKPLADRRDLKPAQSHVLVSPVAAWYLANILSQAPMPDGLTSPLLASRSDNASTEIAFKTGTSYGFRDAWAIGYTSERTVGVWVGRVEGTPRPGFYGRNTAAPLLFKVFDGLPSAGWFQQPPAGALIVDSNAALPLRLRYFGHERKEAANGPHILYPPSAATLDLIHDTEGGWMPITIAATGGAGQLRFFVNGSPSASSPQRQISWTPDGPGFTTITVVDDKDQKASTVFRLKQSE